MTFPWENATSCGEFKCTAVHFTSTHRHCDPKIVSLTILNITARLVLHRMLFHKMCQKKIKGWGWGQAGGTRIFCNLLSLLYWDSLWLSSTHRQQIGWILKSTFFNLFPYQSWIFQEALNDCSNIACSNVGVWWINFHICTRIKPDKWDC